MRKVKVLFVGSPALAQLMEHLFADRSEFEIVGRVQTLRSLSARAGRAPGLIVASVKPVRTAVGPAIASLKKFSPSSKLILICPVREFVRGARECGADACLEPENLVFHLLPTARVLARKSNRS